MVQEVKQYRIGVLALQGAFAEHINLLKHLPDVAETVEVRTVQQLEDPTLDGLIIPGGESTTMALVAEASGLFEPLRKFVQTKPTWGTCAGLILLAKEASKTKKGGQKLLGALDVSVNRNNFGTQIDSFVANLTAPCIGEKPYSCFFIRAPVITYINEETVEPLVKLEDGTIVAVRQGHLMGTSFHPELTSDDRFHRYFLQVVRESQATA
ncbi:SNO glutamine amidotransferase [Basidiobolus meristosporus CBS 931.73]|uniref:glutaminase n=1 Tax=Basidiobolus meristosporus CBS 931.73 TaxID=1314790 RepID=A0A1Y1Y1A7_9FUNG|nr:SNO glutamine amidotransferase [Basidiobolus meristosporus CBS 931.73]|eukprot:ORX91414.1 SNO glutamine amidotransferase [Basidiobolus meristosporus CBS 931.73]